MPPPFARQSAVPPGGEDLRAGDNLLRSRETPDAPGDKAARAFASVGEPDLRTLRRCFFRSYLVAAAFNTQGLQNIGLAYAMEPGLAAVHPDPEAFRAAMARHLTVYNSHPMWAPLLVGVFLSVEVKIARGLAPPDMLDDVKSTTAYTLSAVGDSFFGGSLLGLWGLGAACLAATGNTVGVAVLALCMLLCLNVFKAATFWAGYREGFQVLKRLKRWDLINWGRHIKVLNAVMLTFLWLLSAPRAVGALSLGDLIIISGLGIWAVTEPRFPREMAIAALVAAGLCLAAFRVS
ncbi:MAG: PTS system mannose/fructose/sorbose family transporter subunit IID [Desulfovibrionaceae bacterium]|nr:PTS system mannose/fructose/sorbose family transporter subunit IID [Desulfovibrionaceae bacterium]